MKLAREEIARKLLHLFALSMPVAIFYTPQLKIPAFAVPAILLALFVASVVVELVRFRVPVVQKIVLSTFGHMMRKEEHFKVSGWTWVIGAAFLCAVLFAKHPHVSFIVLTLFILGDAAAALVGISLGRIKIGKKSLEGSLACLGLCLLLFFAAFPHVPRLLEVWGGRTPFIVVVITSVVITLFELIPLRITKGIVINDNLAVPVIAGYAIVGLEKLLSF